MNDGLMCLVTRPRDGVLTVTLSSSLHRIVIGPLSESWTSDNADVNTITGHVLLRPQ